MTIYTNQALFKGVNKRAVVVPNLYTNQTSLKGEKKEAWDVSRFKRLLQSLHLRSLLSCLP